MDKTDLATKFLGFRRKTIAQLIWDFPSLYKTDLARFLGTWSKNDSAAQMGYIPNKLV